MGLTGIFTRNSPIPRRPVTAEEIVQDKIDPKVEREVISNLTLTLWLGVISNFRSDEESHEGQRFRSAAPGAVAGAERLPPDRAPEGILLRQLLAALAHAVPERVAALHDRIEDLLGTCRNRDRELNTLKLSTSWQTDELERCRTMINAALRGRETMMPPGGVQPLISELLATLLNVQRPAPRVQVHEGRRRDKTTGADQTPESGTRTITDEAEDGEIAGLRRILREVVKGEASAGKLGRVLGDLDLARCLADMAAENRTYRHTLKRIGLLPAET